MDWRAFKSTKRPHEIQTLNRLAKTVQQPAPYCKYKHSNDLANSSGTDYQMMRLHRWRLTFVFLSQNFQNWYKHVQVNNNIIFINFVLTEYMYPEKERN